jgi:pimeloyl-ACP methyl ester carboxylesterase/predicted  nucleic acid-binding Zn-ribbon protein
MRHTFSAPRHEREPVKLSGFEPLEERQMLSAEPLPTDLAEPICSEQAETARVIQETLSPPEAPRVQAEPVDQILLEDPRVEEARAALELAERHVEDVRTAIDATEQDISETLLEIDAVKAQLKDLCAEEPHLQEALSALQEESAATEERLHTLIASGPLLEDRHATLMSEQETAQSQMTSLQANLSDTKSQEQTAEDHLVQATQAADGARATLTSATAALAQAKQTLDAAGGTLKQANDNLTQAQKNRDTAQKNYDQAKADVVAAEKNLEKAKRAAYRSIKERNAAIQSAQTRLTDAKKRRDTAKKNLDAAQSAVTAAQQQQSDAQRTYDGAKTTYDSALKTQQDAQAAFDAAETARREAEHERDDLEHRVQGLSDQIASEEAALLSLEQQIAETERAIDILPEQQAEAQAALDDVLGRIASKEDELDANAASQATLSANLDLLGLHLQELQQTLSRGREELADAGAALARAQEKLAEANEQAQVAALDQEALDEIIGALHDAEERMAAEQMADAMIEELQTEALEVEHQQLEEATQAQEEALANVNLSNVDLQRIQQTSLYERSRWFVDGNAYDGLLKRAFPSVFVDDVGAEARRRVDERSDVQDLIARGKYGEQCGIEERNIIEAQAAYRESFRSTLPEHQRIIGDLLATGARILWMRGQSEEWIRQEAEKVADLVRENFRTGAYWYKGQNIGGRLDQLHVAYPRSFEEVMAETERLNAEMQEMFARLQSDQEVARERQENIDQLAARGWTQTALGEWVYVSTAAPDLTILPSGSSVSEDRRMARAQRLADAALRSALQDPEHAQARTLMFAENQSALREFAERVDRALAGHDGDVSSLREQLRDAIASNITDVPWTAVLGDSENVHPLGSIPLEGRTTPESIDIPRGKSLQIPFTLDKAMMVNVWVNPGEIPGTLGERHDLSLTLSGAKLIYPYSSSKPGDAAESISSPLPAGDYVLTVRDKTDYSFMMPAELPEWIHVEVDMNIKKYNTAAIEGVVSVTNREIAMPVSMRVAEFDPKTNLRKKSSEVSTLNPSKPVYVVIHGRGDNESSDPMEVLERNLWLNDVQVVSLDWHQGAADNSSRIGLQGSKWIETTGAWAGNQLMAAGLRKEHLTNVYFVGHSWGAYVAYEAAEKMGKIGGIIALDPAADNKSLGGKYDVSQVDFSRHANTSYAFHSSMFGDRDRALTAQVMFDVVASEGYEGGLYNTETVQNYLRQRYMMAVGSEIVDEVRDAWKEHGFAVTLFSSLLKNARGGSPDSIATLLAPSHLQTSTPSFMSHPDHSEGVFLVIPNDRSTYTKGNDAGDPWWKAEEYYFFDGDDDEAGAPPEVLIGQVGLLMQKPDGTVEVVS